MVAQACGVGMTGAARRAAVPPSIPPGCQTVPMKQHTTRRTLAGALTPSVTRRGWPLGAALLGLSAGLSSPASAEIGLQVPAVPAAVKVKATTAAGRGATFTVQAVPLPAGFQHAYALALNGRGQVLFVAHKGPSDTSNDADALYLWTGSALRALPLPGGIKTSLLASSVGRSCLADDGRIVMNTFSGQLPLYYDGRTFTPIRFPNPDIFIQTCASDLSAVATDQNTGQSYRWEPKTGQIRPATDLAPGVNDVNRAGQFVGSSHVRRAEGDFRVAKTQWKPLFLNDAGLILGEDVAGDGASLYVWPKGERQPSQVARPDGTDAVFPMALNEKGQALVGYLPNMFIYTHATRSYRPLRMDGWKLQVTLTLNDQGWVLAQATQEGQSGLRTVILKPR